MLATRSKIGIVCQIEVRDATFLAWKNVAGGGKDHAAFIVSFMDDLVVNQYFTFTNSHPGEEFHLHLADTND